MKQSYQVFFGDRPGGGVRGQKIFGRGGGRGYRCIGVHIK